MIRMLVSVRDAAEAQIAAAAGADFIDLKDPAAGALGALAPERIREILAALRAASAQQVVSATIGDLPAEQGESVLARVAEVGACGVDLVKVGLPGRGGTAALALLERLATMPQAIVPVLVADHGLDGALLARACELPFAALMLDTQQKRAGSLFDLLPVADCAAFIDRARAAGRPVGLAGALRPRDLPILIELAPDFAGFRSAVCEGERTAALCARRVRELRASLGTVAVGAS